MRGRGSVCGLCGIMFGDCANVMFVLCVGPIWLPDDVGDGESAGVFDGEWLNSGFVDFGRAPRPVDGFKLTDVDVTNLEDACVEIGVPDIVVIVDDEVDVTHLADVVATGVENEDGENWACGAETTVWFAPASNELLNCESPIAPIASGRFDMLDGVVVTPLLKFTMLFICC